MNRRRQLGRNALSSWASVQHFIGLSSDRNSITDGTRSRNRGSMNQVAAVGEDLPKISNLIFSVNSPKPRQFGILVMDLNVFPSFPLKHHHLSMSTQMKRGSSNLTYDLTIVMMPCLCFPKKISRIPVPIRGTAPSGTGDIDIILLPDAILPIAPMLPPLQDSQHT